MRFRSLLLLALVFLLPAITRGGTAPRIIGVTQTSGVPIGIKVPKLTIDSDAAITNRVLYSTNVNGPSWTVLTNVWVLQTPYSIVDPQPSSMATRFYRVQAQFPSPPPIALPIPEGAFVMGNFLESSYADEVPIHTNYLSEFYMEAKLVTQTLWDEVYQWALAHNYDFENAGSAKETNHPVVTVSWYDAVKWCNARSEKEGLVAAYYTDPSQAAVYRTGRIDMDSASVKWNAGYRLPTEAEWEKAARGGATGHAYPWRDKDQFEVARANVTANPTFATGPFPFTSPAGYFAPNGYGLYDMAGNAWEWCWDWYDAGWYATGAASNNDTRGPDSGEYRLLRGGSWNDSGTLARCSQRGFDAPYTAFNAYGFRCAKGH